MATRSGTASTVGTLRVLIADDHKMIRRGVRNLLSEQPRWEICGEAADGQESVEKVKTLHPNAIILDINMPVMSGIEAAREIRRIAPATKIVFLTAHENQQLVSEAWQAGADAVITKGDAAISLTSTMDRLFAVSASGLAGAEQSIE